MSPMKSTKDEWHDSPLIGMFGGGLIGIVGIILIKLIDWPVLLEVLVLIVYVIIAIAIFTIVWMFISEELYLRKWEKDNFNDRTPNS